MTSQQHTRPTALRWHHWLLPLCGLLCSFGSVAQAQNTGAVWIEGENTSAANVTPKVEGTGRGELVSEGKWLHVSIANDKVEKEVPEEGVVLSYSFNITNAGAHEIWNRIGFEASRTQFDWRLDGGEWITVAPDVPTLDLTELALWTDIGWLKLAQRSLTAGAHKLDIRLPRAKNEKNEWRNINYASDALLITPGTFHPNGKFKPGENYRDATDQQATNNVFQLPVPPAAGARASVPLKGLWEVARHDDNTPGEVAAPIRDFPSAAALESDCSSQRQEQGAPRSHLCASSLVSHTCERAAEPDRTFIQYLLSAQQPQHHGVCERCLLWL
jgi:hypothetical protein